MPGRPRPRTYSLPCNKYTNNIHHRERTISKTSQISLPHKICDEVEIEPNESEIEVLAEFMKLAKSSLDIPNKFYEDEYYYLKWLRARNYDLDKAKEMLHRHLEWKVTCTYLPGIMSYTPPVEVLEHMVWKRLGNDPEGRPIYCFLVGRADVKWLLANGFLEGVRRYMHKILEILQYETNEQRKETGYGKAIGIIDMTGFTFAKAMSVELIQNGIYFARCFEANYPESLHRGFVLNASWFFTSVYNAVKPFLSEETIDKIQIHGSDQSKYLPALESSVPMEILPVEYGGIGGSVQDFELGS